MGVVVGEVGLDAADVDAYLRRIGASCPDRLDAAALRELQERHLLAVPFENLSIHLGEPIVLEDKALFDKIVGRRRGGFCYELNGAFAALLTALGCTVTMLAAPVCGRDGLGPPFDHLALRVDLAEPWLVDVGFGRFSRHPLRLDSTGQQQDPAGVFTIVPSEDDWDLDVSHNGKPQYRIEPRPRTLDEFEPTCWWHQTSPKSHFTSSLVCSRVTEAGQVTLGGRTLIVTENGDRRQRTLSSDAEVLAAYESNFGFVLDRVPEVSTPAGSPAFSRQG